MSAPAGATVRLYVDLAARVSCLDVIETETGRRYLVTSVRVQLLGERAGRQHLGCVVMAPGDDAPPRATTHRIRWYRRRKRARWRW